MIDTEIFFSRYRKLLRPIKTTIKVLGDQPKLPRVVDCSAAVLQAAGMRTGDL